MLIHIVDDDPKIRGATSFLLARQGYKTQIYASIDELLGQQRLRDGCVLLKWGMPGLDTRGILLALEAKGSPPVIVIGEGTTATAAVEAFRGGALDFLQRPHDETELIAAVERALDRSSELGVHRQRRNSSSVLLARLSPRKRQVLQGLLAGMSNKVIAQRLALSPRTVELHRASMMEELGVGSLAEALRLAIDADLTPLNETVFGSELSEAASPALNAENGEALAVGSSDIAPSPMPPVIDALEGTTDCVFLIDREWRFTYINRNARELLAVGDDLLGMVLWDAYPLSSGTRAWSELHRAATDRQATRFEFYEPGLRSWLDVSVRPYAGGLQVSFRNISGERFAGAQLKLSEETLLQVLEAAGDGAWDWNVQTGEIAMSSSYLSRLGYGPGAFPQHFDSLIHLVHPDDLPMLTRCLRDHIDGYSSSFRCEYRLRRHDGSWLWSLDRGRVVARDPITALPLRMVGTASDITHIKAAQQKAEEALERLALAQTSAGLGTWDLDLKSGGLLLCERSRIMHGLPTNGSDPLTELDWLETVHPDDRQPALREFRAHVATMETYHMRYRTVAPDGSVRLILGMGRAVPVESGSPARFVGFNVDITNLHAHAHEADGFASNALVANG